MERYDSSDLVQIAPVWGDKMRTLNEAIEEKLSSSLLVIADKGRSDYQIVQPDSYPTPAIAADMQQVARSRPAHIKRLCLSGLRPGSRSSSRRFASCRGYFLSWGVASVA